MILDYIWQPSGLEALLMWMILGSGQSFGVERRIRHRSLISSYSTTTHDHPARRRREYYFDTPQSSKQHHASYSRRSHLYLQQNHSSDASPWLSSEARRVSTKRIQRFPTSNSARHPDNRAKRTEAEKEVNLYFSKHDSILGRRNMIAACYSGIAVTAVSPLHSWAFDSARDTTKRAPGNPNPIDEQKEFVYSDDWTGTRLPWRSLEQVTAVFDDTKTTINGDNNPTWPMARWPDPVLRQAAQPVSASWWGTPQLHAACQTLRRTALANGAVGLAAQQCGINARIIYLQDPAKKKGRQNDGWMLINPRIVQRSPERDMRVWREECLVLPPTFRATVLRDNWVDVEYDVPLTLPVSQQQQQSQQRPRRIVHRFHGELARALQHEYDHDRGILITDHVDLQELESHVMRQIERPGHEQRMERAYSRAVE